MIFIQLSAFILLVMGIVWALELTPERINKDLSGFFEKRESLQDMSRVSCKKAGFTGNVSRNLPIYG